MLINILSNYYTEAIPPIKPITKDIIKLIHAQREHDFALTGLSSL